MDGSILKLPGKLDRLLHHGCNLPKGATDEIPLIKGDLEKIIAITSNLENHHAMKMKARCWRKEVRELSYDLEDFVDQYEHAVQRIQRWGGRYSSPPYRRLVQEGAPKPTLQFCPWMKEWKLVSNKKERNKRIGERKNKTKDGVVDEPLLSSSPASACYRKIKKSKAALPWLREKLRLRLWMANEIREFSVRVQEALQRHSSYNLEAIGGSSSTGCINDAYSASGNSMCKEENTYVGIGAALEKLEELLMAKHDHRHQKLKVVSIVGFGGIGKTTLVTEFYRKFGLQFECRAFVRTAQKPDVRRIFISMLSQVRPHQAPDNWTVHGLISTIRTHLEDKRYLIIVEDLSATSTWDIVKCALPDSNCCSRILTTTEIEDLALQCCGHDPKHVYKMKPLGEDNSRELFFSSLFGPQHKCPPELKEISYDIISKCGGLPLAIVTVASILSSQPATQDQWHYVNNSIGYNLLISHSLEGMKQVLNLSYNNLPHHLKACILYTCLYEEDIIFYRDDLVNQWIAEGFIQATEGEDKKEIARSFFDRLISGKMILPVDVNRNGEVLSCTVHHMVLNLVIRYKSTEENFVTAIHHSQAPTTIADNVRRLSLQFGNAADAKAPVNVTLPHIRTLAILGVFKCLPSVVQFPLLQVLILHFWGNKDSINFDITGISELFRLRYLKVTSNVILKLCTKMRSMQSLETLTIDARISAVPSDIVHLPGLLHLNLPAETDLPNGIGNLTSLRKLGYFDLSSNSMENVQSLRMLTNIEDLQLTCSTVEPDNLGEKMHFVLNSVFETLRNLKSLTMVPRASSYAKSIDDAGAAGTTISIALLSAPALLRCLEVSPRICRFFCLPKWIGQLHNLCVLKFGVTKIDRDGIDILGGLPDLAVLSLYVHMKPEMGIVIGKTGFPVIKYFKFKCCDPCLKFEEGAMPNLRKLKLAFNACSAGRQNTIPVGINYLSELKEVSAQIGGSGPEDSHTRAAKSAFRDAIRVHDRIQRVNIQCVKQIIFGNDDQSDITPFEDSPRSGEETTHFQNERKQRKEEEAEEAIEVSESSHGAVAKKVVLKLDLQDNKDKQKIVAKLHKVGSAAISSARQLISNLILSRTNNAPSVDIVVIEKRLQKLTFNDLIVATNGFHNNSLIGSGAFGDVYKAQLKDGKVVAIKKLINASGQGHREFTAEMETIGRIKHPNLVPLLGYCGEKRLLVYDYMTFGSLEDVLHDRKKVGVKLNWAARKKIAFGAARGLAYLHHNCITHIIHRDMKSSNVLIDEQLEARVSDFGMARITSLVDTHLSVSTLSGTPGYVPPEYYQSFRCTTKGDVYSYGVILLELLTGKPPTDSADFGEDNNLVGWVKQHSKQNLTDVFDPELVKEDPALELELLEHLRIACVCLDDRPSKRPTMLQVVTMFKEAKSAVDSKTSECTAAMDDACFRDVEI